MTIEQAETLIQEVGSVKPPARGARRPRDESLTVVAVEPPPSPPVDLQAPEWYLNRELTWLGFNRRVLHEAQDERTPLLERVKFLAIVSSNLDEFFMKRIGGLKQQSARGCGN